MPQPRGAAAGRCRLCPGPLPAHRCPASPCVLQTGEAVRELLQRLRELQSERVETYRLFEE